MNLDVQESIYSFELCILYFLGDQWLILVPAVLSNESMIEQYSLKMVFF